MATAMPPASGPLPCAPEPEPGASAWRDRCHAAMVLWVWVWAIIGLLALAHTVIPPLLWPVVAR